MQEWKKTPQFRARVRFSVEATRQRHVAADFWLGCPMDIAGDMHDCRLWAPAGFQIADGEMAEVLGIFIRPDPAMPKLSKQCGFTLWDGGTIGHGELLELLPADESQDS